MIVTSAGCTATRSEGNHYDISINSVGPYSLTASRAGNYGYNEATAFATGMSKKANQNPVSISGWTSNKSVGDTFIIHINGGIEEGVVHFATAGCTVSPITGTTETQYFVTISSVGAYSLSAFVDGTANYNGANSREVKGTAVKATQPRLSIDNWNGSAAIGSSFDIHVLGGNGTGATSVTTSGGCYAVPKGDTGDAYTVTVTTDVGGAYSLSASKLGDANYLDGEIATVEGVAGKKNQTALKVNGWKDNSQAGDAFAIHLDGGTGNGKVAFQATGCIVEPASGDIDDVYTITVTADAGETYQVAINRDGSGGFEQTSVLKSGNVRPTVKLHNAHENETETPMLGANYDILLLLGMVALLVILLTAAIILQFHDRRARRRYR